MVFRCLDFLRLLICYLVADVEWFAVKKILLQFVLGSTKICLSFTGFAFRLHHRQRQTNEKRTIIVVAVTVVVAATGRSCLALASEEGSKAEEFTFVYTSKSC